MRQTPPGFVAPSPSTASNLSPSPNTRKKKKGQAAIEELKRNQPLGLLTKKKQIEAASSVSRTGNTTSRLSQLGASEGAKKSLREKDAKNKEVEKSKKKAAYRRNT